MACHSIVKLSAYLENQLSSEDKKQTDEHLKTCSQCSIALEDLKKTVAYTQGLQEVEPPPWIRQKVMTRLREEAAQQKGIFQKLFFPLHIKVPLEVFATLAIAVTAIYIVKTIEPSTRTAQSPFLRPPPQMFSQQMAQPPKETEVIAKGETLKKAQGPELRGYKSEALSEPSAQMDKQKDVKEFFEIMASSEIAGPSSVSKSREKVDELSRYGDERMRLQGLSLEDKSASAQGAYIKRYGSPWSEGKIHRISLTVTVEEIEPATEKIEKGLAEYEGKIVKKEFYHNKIIIISEIGSSKLNKLYEKLKLAGEVKEKDISDALKGVVLVTIEIVKKQM